MPWTFVHTTAAVVLAAAIIVPQGIHTIKEGHVGVYYRGGAMLSSITHPGVHLKLPGITSVYEVDVSMQTDNVENIPCGTSGGVMIYFDKIEVRPLFFCRACETNLKLMIL